MIKQSADNNKPAVTLMSAVRYLVPLIILGLAVHLILPQFATLEHSYQVIKGMLLWAVACAFASQITSYLGSGYLIKALINLFDSRLTVWRGAMITLAAASFGMVAGGVVGSAAATYRYLRKMQVKPEAAALAGTFPGLINAIVLVSVSLLGLINLLVIHQLTKFQAVGFAFIIALLLSLIGLLLWGLRKRDSFISLIGLIISRLAKLFHREYQPERNRARMADMFKAVDLLLAGGWRGPLLGAALNVVFDMFTIYFLFIAAGHRINFAVLLTGYGLPLLLGRIAFIIPGGVGVIESTMAHLYSGLGVPYATAVVVVLIYRFLSFWFPLLLGFPLITVLVKK